MNKILPYAAAIILFVGAGVYKISERASIDSSRNSAEKAKRQQELIEHHGLDHIRRAAARNPEGKIYPFMQQ